MKNKRNYSPQRSARWRIAEKSLSGKRKKKSALRPQRSPEANPPTGGFSAVKNVAE